MLQVVAKQIYLFFFFPQCLVKAANTASDKKGVSELLFSKLQFTQAQISMYLNYYIYFYFRKEPVIKIETKYF